MRAMFMKFLKLILILTSSLTLVACAAKKQNQIPAAGANTQTPIGGSQLRNLMVSNLDINQLKTPSQEFSLAALFQQAQQFNKKVYVVQFATAYCSSCQHEGVLINQYLNSGGSQYIEHKIVMVAGNNEDVHGIQNFMTQANATANKLLMDRDGKSNIILNPTRTVKVPATVILTASGQDHLFLSDVTPEALMQNIQTIVQREYQ